MRKDRIWPLLLALIFMIPCSWSQEPISLSSGAREEVVNLDIGASQPGCKPFMTRTGFVSPPVPQITALSPNAILHQAKALRDEAEAIRDEASDILRDTETAASSAKKDAEIIKSLAETVRADASSCAEKADLAATSLEEARTIYNRTSEMALIVSSATEKNEALANRTSEYAAAAEENLNASRIMLGQIALKVEELEALYSRYLNEEKVENSSGNASTNYTEDEEPPGLIR